MTFFLENKQKSGYNKRCNILSKMLHLLYDKASCVLTISGNGEMPDWEASTTNKGKLVHHQTVQWLLQFLT